MKALQIKEYTVLLDDDDWLRLCGYRWQVRKNKNGSVRFSRSTTLKHLGHVNRKKYQMHRAIYNPPYGLDLHPLQKIKNINGDYLDCRKENLHILKLDNKGEANKRHGEYIQLNWHYQSPDAYYIRGWISTEEGKTTLTNEGAIIEYDEVGSANHMYGRWSMEPREYDNGHILRTYKESGRGRFKITEFGIGIYAKKEKKI